MAGKLLAGKIVNYLFERGYKDAPFRYYSVSLLLATPAGNQCEARSQPLR
ncbi:MAG: hypothetical protein OXC05_02850 [Halieaceae bacterium]|nr:hypothetical protein [Halieaceae bacterium]